MDSIEINARQILPTMLSITQIFNRDIGFLFTSVISTFIILATFTAAFMTNGPKRRWVLLLIAKEQLEVTNKCLLLYISIIWINIKKKDLIKLINIWCDYRLIKIWWFVDRSECFKNCKCEMYLRYVFLIVELPLFFATPASLMLVGDRYARENFGAFNDVLGPYHRVFSCHCWSSKKHIHP